MDPSVSMNMGPVSNLQTTDVSSPIFANRLYLYRNVSSKPFFIIPKYFLYKSKKFPVFGWFLIFLGRCFFLFPYSVLVFLYVRPTVFLFVSCFPDFIVFVSVRPKYFSVSVF